MKKNIALAVTMAAALAVMTGCSGKPAETTAAETKATEAVKTEETTAEKAEETSAAEAGVNADSRLGKILSAGKITLGTSPDFAPSEFIDTSSGKPEYVGSDIELAKYIAEKLGVQLEIKAMEFSAIQQALISGTVDMGISGFAYTDERAETLGLSDFFNLGSDDGQGLLVMGDKVSEYNSAEAFAGKKIAAQNASLQQMLVKEQLPADVNIQTIGAVTDGVMMLVTGKVDAVAVSGDNGISLAKAYPEIAMAEFMFADDRDGNVVAVQKGEDELLEAINGILAEVNEKGLYEEWKTEAKALADSLGIKTE